MCTNGWRYRRPNRKWRRCSFCWWLWFMMAMMPALGFKHRSLTPSTNVTIIARNGFTPVTPATPSAINGGGQCPQSDDHHILLPCTCNASTKEIFCRGGGSATAGTAEQQLCHTFLYYAKWIPIPLRRFNSIYINLRNLTRLKARLFNGIQFANVLLRGSDLELIDRDAFLGTERHVYTLFLYETSLRNQPEQYDFFAAVRSLVNLQKLIIVENKLTDIPDRAFNPLPINGSTAAAATTDSNNDQPETEDGRNETTTTVMNSGESQLTEIQITRGRLQTIGTDAFASLAHLEQLLLNKNQINRIKPYAFRMDRESNATLKIDLTDNDLNGTSFEPNALLGSRRPVKIHLGLNGCNSRLDHLSEDVFRPFLDENPKNTIDVGRHCFNLQCGCRMDWISSERYRLRVKNFRCSNDHGAVVYFTDYMRNKTCPLAGLNRMMKPVSAMINQTADPADQTKSNEIDHSSSSSSKKNSTTTALMATDGHSGIDPRELCSTKICAKQAIEMNTYLNRSVDPCDSFYDFACNGWENKHLLEYLVQVLSNGGSEYDNFVKVQLKIQKNFEKLLTISDDPPVEENSTAAKPASETPSTVASGGDSPAHSPLINNVRLMYTACVKQEQNRKMMSGAAGATATDGTGKAAANQAALERVLADIGGWPLLTKTFARDDYRWEKYFATVVNRYNDRIFIEMEPMIDEQQMKHLMIKSGGLIVSRRKLLSVKLNRLESYANYILNTVLYFGGTNHQNETMDEVWEMIKFEKQIADLAKKSMGFEFMIQRPLQTLGCLIPEIDWLYILNNLHRIAITGTPDDCFVEAKSMFDVHYLIELSRLLARTDQRIIANYIGWRVIDAVGFLIGGAGFTDIQQNFYSTESREILKAMRKQCLEPLITSVPYLMARIYLERHLPPKARNHARQVVETVKQSFIETMRKKNWPEEPKRGLIEKVEKININIGYPDWILDDQQLENYYSTLNYNVSNGEGTQLLEFYSKVQEMKMFHMLKNIGEPVNKSQYWDPLPLHVGATYDFVGHIITIPMGLLQPPFFEDDRPFYLNYASLGSFFGHELSHSVTPRYSEFDQLLPPWNQNFLKDYLFKAQCFVSQYNGYYDKEAELHLDGTRTFEEDMSDLAGIQAAYHAYQETAKRMILEAAKNGSIPFPQRIQELPEFTNEMLFFISFAQKWCRSSSRVQTRMRISKSVHSPEKYRVNGALSNLDAFSRAFDCQPGSPMNPAKRCESW